MPAAPEVKKYNLTFRNPKNGTIVSQQVSVADRGIPERLSHEFVDAFLKAITIASQDSLELIAIVRHIAVIHTMPAKQDRCLKQTNDV